MSRENRNNEQSFFGPVLSIELKDCGKKVRVDIKRKNFVLDDPDTRSVISGCLGDAMVEDELIGFTIFSAIGRFFEQTVGQETSDAIFASMKREISKFNNAKMAAGNLFDFNPEKQRKCTE